MRIGIATPAARGSRIGNRLTALRWAGLLRQLGHSVVLRALPRESGPVADGFGAGLDVLVAVHARRSHGAVLRWRAERGAAPLVVVLSGTDVYEDLPGSAEVLRSLDLADAIVALQPRALAALPGRVRPKGVVIEQSATPPRGALPRDPAAFVAVVAGHLRAVKAPFLAAQAARLLPPGSRVRVDHLGAAVEPGFAERARSEAAASSRWRWLGEASHGDVKRRVAAADLLLVTSRSEGGANVVGEAIVCGTPVLSTRMAGSTGLLGDDYPGLFPVDDADALAAMLRRCEEDAAFLGDLRERCEALRPRFAPEREREAWRRLLEKLTRR